MEGQYGVVFSILLFFDYTNHVKVICTIVLRDVVKQMNPPSSTLHGATT
jgi:hypothetical protein